MLNRLSLDVVRMVFEDWVSNKLTDLSSLDIAFTNRQARAVLLKELLPFVTPVCYTGGSEANDLLMRTLGEYKTFEPTVNLLVWLSERKVPAVSLFVELSKYAYCKDTTPFTLHGVRTLHLIAYFDSMTFHWPCLEAFLPSFPNLTELDASKWGEMKIESVQQLTSLGGTIPLKILNLENAFCVYPLTSIVDCVHAFPLIDELQCPVDTDALMGLLDVSNRFHTLYLIAAVFVPLHAVLELCSKHAETLEELVLTGVLNFDDKMILNLVTACPNIVSFTLGNESDIILSPALVGSISASGSKLKELWVNCEHHAFK